MGWQVNGQQAVGSFQSVASGSGPTVTVTWGTTAEAVNPFPWGGGGGAGGGGIYPSLLVLQVGFQYTASSAVFARRPRVTVTQPEALGTTIVPASQTTTASQSRRYEFGAGMALDGSTAGQQFREPFPEGLVLLSSADPASSTPGFLTITIDNGQSGDTMLGITITGLLLLPGRP
jgi:hypothetical protein